jgi:hypothetical protein
MTKTDILIELHAVIAARLLGKGPWLMEREDALNSNERAVEIGLQEQTEDGRELTPLGKEVDFNLLSLFMGRWDHITSQPARRPIFPIRPNAFRVE